MAERHAKTYPFIAAMAAFVDRLKKEVFTTYGGGAVTGTSDAGGTGATGASGTGAVTGAPATTTTAKVQAFAAPAADGVGVHAAIASDNASPVTTGITNPAIPRSLQVVFHASWDGGDVTIVGTDQFDAPVTEVIADAAGSTVQGTKIFKTVTSINQETVGAGGTAVATVQTGPKLGLDDALVGAHGLAHVDGAADAATFDATYSGVTFTSAPDGVKNYVVAYSAAHTHAAGTLAGPSHTHTGPSHTHGPGSFAAGPVAAPVHFDRAEYAVTAAAASDLETSRALLRDIVIVYLRHAADTLAHVAADETNIPGDPLADILSGVGAATLGDLQDVANEIKGHYNAHRSESGVHADDDTGHAISSADASDQTSLNTLLNEIKTDLNAHLLTGLTTPSWRATAV